MGPLHPDDLFHSGAPYLCPHLLLLPGSPGKQPHDPFCGVSQRLAFAPPSPPSPVPAACSSGAPPCCGPASVPLGMPLWAPTSWLPAQNVLFPDVLTALATSTCLVSPFQALASFNWSPMCPHTLYVPIHSLDSPVSEAFEEFFAWLGIHCPEASRPSRKPQAGSATAFLCSHSHQLGLTGVTEHFCPCAADV